MRNTGKFSWLLPIITEHCEINSAKVECIFERTEVAVNDGELRIYRIDIIEGRAYTTIGLLIISRDFISFFQ